MGTKVVLFTQANMNAIDGSSVWAQSMGLALAGVEGVHVTVLLSHPSTTDRMLGPLLSHPGVTVIDPFATGLTARTELTLDIAARILAGLAAHGAKAFIVRGSVASHHLAGIRSLRGKLWPYLTDVPQRVEEVDAEAMKRIETIMSASPVLLCQTEELRSFLESKFPAVAGKARVFPPVIPEDIAQVLLPPPTPNHLSLCYSGKFARSWNTYEMCDLPARLSERGITASLTMVGDKVNKDADWPGFVVEMRRKLESSPGVDWVGGVTRERSIELMATAHLGLSWRSPELDESLELSTKLLEYCAAGTPPVLNRTPMHERIFGEDYPLFVDRDTEVTDLLETVVQEPALYQRALDQIAGFPAGYTLAKASTRLASIMDEVRSRRSRGSLRRRSPSRGADN